MYNLWLSELDKAVTLNGVKRRFYFYPSSSRSDQLLPELFGNLWAMNRATLSQPQPRSSKDMPSVIPKNVLRKFYIVNTSKLIEPDLWT